MDDSELPVFGDSLKNIQSTEKVSETVVVFGIDKKTGIRNFYTLQIYEQVNKMVAFTSGALLKLKDLDEATNYQETLFSLLRSSLGYL